MTFDDVMKRLQPLAELVASNRPQKVILGDINGSTEIVRTGHLDSEKKFISRINDHCDQFSDYSTNGCLCASSSNSNSQTELGDMARRNSTNNNHKPKKQRLKYSVELMTPTTTSKRRKQLMTKMQYLWGKCHIKGVKCDVWSE